MIIEMDDDLYSNPDNIIPLQILQIQWSDGGSFFLKSKYGFVDYRFNSLDRNLRRWSHDYGVF